MISDNFGRQKLWSSFRNDLTPPSPFLPDLAQRASGPDDRSGA